jgi:hypothetical protein
MVNIEGVSAPLFSFSLFIFNHLRPISPVDRTCQHIHNSVNLILGKVFASRQIANGYPRSTSNTPSSIASSKVRLKVPTGEKYKLTCRIAVLNPVTKLCMNIPILIVRVNEFKECKEPTFG